MAKRSRGAARPGQLRPTTRRPQQPARRAGSAAATEDLRTGARVAPEETYDADTAVVTEAPAPAPARRRDRARDEAAATRAPRVQASGLLADRAAQEYAYVARDVRHIVAVGGGLFLVLLVVFLLIDVLHVVTL